MVILGILIYFFVRCRILFGGIVFSVLLIIFLSFGFLWGKVNESDVFGMSGIRKW